MPVAYLRLSDDLPDHPKISRISDGTFRFFINSICWCQKHLTDGKVPVTSIQDIPRYRANRVSELLEAGLWERDGDNYAVHDFLQHNDSKSEIKARQKRTADRVAAWRNRHPKVVSDEAPCNGVTYALQTADVTPFVTPPLSSPLLSSVDTKNVSTREQPAYARSSRVRADQLIERTNSRIQNTGDPVPLWDWQFGKFRDALKPQFGDEAYSQTTAWMHRVGDEITAAGGRVDVSDPVKWWDARYAKDWAPDPDAEFKAACRALGKAARA
jgi:hypothetical protein